MGRLPKRTVVLEPGGLYFLDGRRNELEMFSSIVSRQKTKNWKYIKFLEPNRFNLFLVGEVPFFGICYVRVIAMNKNDDSGIPGFIKKDEFLQAITGKSALKYK
jgi:hypothetical protein